MRIPVKQLANHLKNTLAPVYLLFGEEPLQRMEAGDAIRAKARENGYEERLIFELRTAESDWVNLNHEINAPSLFSEKRLFDCRLADGKIGKLGAEHLNKILNKISQHQIHNNLFIFSLNDKPDTTVSKSAWFTNLERIGVSVVANTPKGRDFSDWLKTRLQNAGLPANFQKPEILECLERRTEGNLLAAAQAVEKLKLQLVTKSDTLNTLNNTDMINKNNTKSDTDNRGETDSINIEAIAKMINVDTRFSLYDLADAALSGSAQRTRQIFTSLKNEGIESILILWVLTREVRAIIPLARLAEVGKLLPNTLREQGVWQHRINLVSSFLKRCPLSNLYRFLMKAENIDSMIKSNRKNDAWQALLSLSLEIAGVTTDDAQV